MSFNVLIVDDSEVMRNVIQRVLNLSGFDLGTVHQAGNGEEALAVLEDNWIDVVITDINMPVMDGIKLLKKMKTGETLSDIPVIIISTEGRTERIEEILKIGAADYITKPFKPEDIRNVMCNALGVDTNGNLAEEPEESDF